MKVERWQKIKDLYESALKYPPVERFAFLEENCGGDADLQREVESLLSFSEGSMMSFMERPAVAEVADLILRQKEKFIAGERLGHYKIIKPLGTGGMGEVYLAQDARLERKVAVKFLAAEFSRNPDRLRRFVLEAKSASALSHPNIITIYEIGDFDGANFIAMEYVSGDSLRHLIGKGKINLNAAIDVAIQTASALTAAHSAGIIHRDIKPENIMRRPDGLVKILDFGLAKQTSFPHDTDDMDSEALTRERIVTAPGTVMGTAAYMSPEQIRGKTVDARTDIWSLGVVLYEMVAGRVPFTGETSSDMLAAILKTEPQPLSLYTENVPPELEKIVRKALGKDRDERYQVVKDLYLDLKALQRDLESAAQKAEQPPLNGKQAAEVRQLGKAESFPQKRHWLWLGAAAMVLLAGLSVWYFTRQNQQAETNFLASLTSMQVTSWKSELSQADAIRARFSPRENLVAYVASRNGIDAIWLKQIDGGEPFTRRPDDARETSPLWSPDGAQIAYISDRGGRRGIWTAPALGGAPVLLAPLESRGQILTHWSKDGALIYFEMRQNLYALDIASKQITKSTNLDESRPMERGFSFSPDEKRIVYADRKDGQKDLWTADRDGANPTRLTNDAAEDSEPIWHKDGKRVIYNSNRTGIKQICLAFLDGRAPVQLTFSDSDSKVSDISADGTKILYSSAKDESDLWGVRTDGGGKEFQLTSDIGVEFWQDAAPNGEQIAYQAARQSSVGDKLFHSLLLSQKTTGDMRQTQMADDGFNPRWSPDGNFLAFLRSTAGNNSLWITSAVGGDARALTAGGIVFGGYQPLPYNRMQTQDYQWSPDSHSLIYCAMRDGISNVWQTAADGSGEKQLTSNAEKSLLFLNPLFSPDGSRIAWLAMSTLDPRKPARSIWILAGDGKTSQVYQSESVLSLIGWSASGQELIVKSVAGASGASPFPVEVSLLQIAAGSNETREIARLKAAYFQNIALAPDRKTIAFVRRTDSGDSIQILPSAGGAGRTLASSSDMRVYFSNLSFAPDGKTIYYGKQANWQIISMINNFK